MQFTSPSDSITIPRIKHRTAIILFFICHGLIFSSWASRIPIIKSTLDLADGALGTLLLMIPIGQLVTMPIVGKLVSKFGSERILTIGMVLYGIALCLIGFTTTVWQLAIVLLLFGTFSNMCNIAINTQGVLVEKIYGKSIMTSFHGAWSIAGFFGALIGIAMLYLNVSTTMHFIIVYAVVLCITFYAQKYLIKTRNEVEEVKEKGFKIDRIIFVFGIIGFCSMAVEGAMFDWSGVYFKDIIKVDNDLVVLGYASFMIMMASGRFIGDRIIQKIGTQKTLIVSGVMMFFGMILSVIFPQMWVCVFTFMLVGLGVACNVPVVFAMAGKHPTISSGMAIAMVSSVSFLGFLMGPPIIGYIAEIFDLRFSFAIFSVFGLLMSFLAFRVKIK